MGREVRMVPSGWKHPKDEEDPKHFKPLMSGYAETAQAFLNLKTLDELQKALDYHGCPDRNDYMPEWTEDVATHYMMYETTSEGTPISPAFATPEELARWLADTGASAFGNETASYEGWLRVAKGGYACSAIGAPGHGLISGVEALKGTPL
jgi:hypothetical protein